MKSIIWEVELPATFFRLGGEEISLFVSQPDRDPTGHPREWYGGGMLTCTCGGEMVVDRRVPLSMLVRSIPRLRCLACERTGGYADWGRNLFPVEPTPGPSGPEPL